MRLNEHPEYADLAGFEAKLRRYDGVRARLAAWVAAEPHRPDLAEELEIFDADVEPGRIIIAQWRERLIEETEGGELVD